MREGGGDVGGVAVSRLPLGATVNMNGTALYESLTVLFIAQLHGVRLSFGATVVVALTSAVAAVGAAASPPRGWWGGGVLPRRGSRSTSTRRTWGRSWRWTGSSIGVARR